MTATSVSLNIWVKTVVSNAFLFAFVKVCTDIDDAMIGLVILLFGGLIVTCPLILVIVPLVQLSTSIPYGTPARIAWMTFFLALLIIIVYVPFLPDSLGNILLGTTIAGLFFAVLTTRKKLLQLHS